MVRTHILACTLFARTSLDYGALLVSKDFNDEVCIYCAPIGVAFVKLRGENLGTKSVTWAIIDGRALFVSGIS